MKFPNKCCRCGACCLFETCLIGKEVFSINDKTIICPALSFNENGVTSCSLAEKLVPIGDGCCISARVCKGGREVQFADLPKDFKFAVVDHMRKKPQTKVICSWCGKVMYFKKVDCKNEISHSICPDCENTILEEIGGKEVDSEYFGVPKKI